MIYWLPFQLCHFLSWVSFIRLVERVSWVSMSKVTSPHFQMEIWAIFFSSIVFFDKFWNSIYLTHIPQSLNKRNWLNFFFLWQRELYSVWNIEILIFLLTMTYFFTIGVVKDIITKIYPRNFNGKMWPYHLLPFSILFYMINNIRLQFLEIISLS